MSVAAFSLAPVNSSVWRPSLLQSTWLLRRSLPSTRCLRCQTDETKGQSVQKLQISSSPTTPTWPSATSSQQAPGIRVQETSRPGPSCRSPNPPLFTTCIRGSLVLDMTKAPGFLYYSPCSTLKQEQRPWRRTRGGNGSV